MVHGTRVLPSSNERFKIRENRLRVRLAISILPNRIYNLASTFQPKTNERSKVYKSSEISKISKTNGIN